MTTTIEKIATARTRRPAIDTLRLRLKPAHHACGFVQGAWWPRSTLLTAELPPLLAAISSRYGTTDRVQYHESDWSPTPQHVKHPGADIALDSSHDQLLGNRTQGPTDLLHTPIALQRWESDGGAVQLAPQSLTHMQV
jgi:hypothetical protein